MILNQFIELTGYHRVYARSVLRFKIPSSQVGDTNCSTLFELVARNWSITLVSVLVSRPPASIIIPPLLI